MYTVCRLEAHRQKVEEERSLREEQLQEVTSCVVGGGS